MPFNAEQGWEIRFCEKCGYAIEKAEATRYIEICPVCHRKGDEVTLVDRFVVHKPVNKVVTPLPEAPQAG
ncbi:hypothetical protein ES703_87647 [subsurface metagenome]